MKYIFLSKEFYDDYAGCPEIEAKRDRPYIMVCVTVGRVTYAVPMRSHIHHKFALMTDEANGCGLDFSKTVVLTDSKYIDADREPYIRPVEYNALRGKEKLVEYRLMQYIRTYKKAKKRLDVPRNRTICEYSTLQYFEEYI